jgi:Fuc2NAc and GlcNAc transferase
MSLAQSLAESLADIAVVIFAGVAAFAVTSVVRRHAVRLGLVAAPNARSSHAAPTPSGGGLGIVAGGSIGGAYAAFNDRPEIAFVVALSLLVAALGLLDDRRPVAPAVRLPIQFLLVGLMVVLVPAAPLGAMLGLHLPWFVLVGALVLAAVYWLNIFNFMDGIDGLAGSQAAFMLLGAAGLAGMAAGDGNPHLWWFAAVAAAVIGFLILNWPPAKIFMGDAGSTYLGFVIAHAAIVTLANGWLSPWQWLILGALFIVDASVTLVRRALRRERLFSAHRLHAYQHLSRRWHGHRRVTLLYLAVDIVLLLPLAWWAGHQPATAPVATAAAYTVLIAGLLWAGAGAPEEPALRTSS